MNQRAHVLVVEDFVELRDAYERCLTSQGFQVSVAGDGKEAISMATELHPDLVVMDLSLPVLNGWEAARQLKADSRTKNIPIVAMAGEHFEMAAVDLIRGTCESFLHKPCAPRDLVAEIKQALKNSAGSVTKF